MQAYMHECVHQGLHICTCVGTACWMQVNVVEIQVYAAVQSARFMTYSEGQTMIVTAIILVGSVNALSYNVVHYLMIQMTSAVTTTVLGEVKIVGLLILSVLLLGKPHLNKSTCSCAAHFISAKPASGIRTMFSLPCDPLTSAIRLSQFAWAMCHA